MNSRKHPRTDEDDDTKISSHISILQWSLIQYQEYADEFIQEQLLSCFQFHCLICHTDLSAELHQSLSTECIKCTTKYCQICWQPCGIDMQSHLTLFHPVINLKNCDNRIGLYLRQFIHCLNTQIKHPLLMAWILIRAFTVLLKHQLHFSTLILDNQLVTDIDFDAASLCCVMKKLEEALETVDSDEHFTILLVWFYALPLNIHTFRWTNAFQLWQKLLFPQSTRRDIFLHQFVPVLRSVSRRSLSLQTFFDTSEHPLLLLQWLQPIWQNSPDYQSQSLALEFFTLLFSSAQPLIAQYFHIPADLLHQIIGDFCALQPGDVCTEFQYQCIQCLLDLAQCSVENADTFQTLQWTILLVPLQHLVYTCIGKWILWHDDGPVEYWMERKAQSDTRCVIDVVRTKVFPLVASFILHLSQHFAPDICQARIALLTRECAQPNIDRAIRFFLISLCGFMKQMMCAQQHSPLFPGAAMINLCWINVLAPYPSPIVLEYARDLRYLVCLLRSKQCIHWFQHPDCHLPWPTTLRLWLSLVGNLHLDKYWLNGAPLDPDDVPASVLFNESILCSPQVLLHLLRIISQFQDLSLKRHLTQWLYRADLSAASVDVIAQMCCDATPAELHIFGTLIALHHDPQLCFEQQLRLPTSTLLLSSSSNDIEITHVVMRSPSLHGMDRFIEYYFTQNHMQILSSIPSASHILYLMLHLFKASSTAHNTEIDAGLIQWCNTVSQTTPLFLLYTVLACYQSSRSDLCSIISQWQLVAGDPWMQQHYLCVIGMILITDCNCVNATFVQWCGNHLSQVLSMQHSNASNGDLFQIQCAIVATIIRQWNQYTTIQQTQLYPGVLSFLKHRSAHPYIQLLLLSLTVSWWNTCSVVSDPKEFATTTMVLLHSVILSHGFEHGYIPQALLNVLLCNALNHWCDLPNEFDPSLQQYMKRLFDYCVVPQLWNLLDSNTASHINWHTVFNELQTRSGTTMVHDNDSMMIFLSKWDRIYKHFHIAFPTTKVHQVPDNAFCGWLHLINLEFQHLLNTLNLSDIPSPPPMIACIYLRTMIETLMLYCLPMLRTCQSVKQMNLYATVQQLVEQITWFYEHSEQFLPTTSYYPLSSVNHTAQYGSTIAYVQQLSIEPLFSKPLIQAISCTITRLTPPDD